MNILDGVAVDGGQVQSFVLEWIVRCHPAFILPVSCLKDGTITNLVFHSDGLHSLGCRARSALAQERQPAAWICGTLIGIMETMARAEEFLLDRHRFRLDVGSVWFRADDDGKDVHDKPSILVDPVLTYIPVDGVVPEGGLSVVANGLLTILEEVQPSRVPDALLEELRSAIAEGEEQVLRFLSSRIADGDKDPRSADGPPRSSLQDERKQPGTRVSRIITLLLAFGIPLLLASIPLIIRFGAMPVHRLVLPGTAGYRILVSAALALMSAFDAFLLFSARSPIRLSPGRHSGVAAARRRSLTDMLEKLRRDVRVSGLIPAVFSRFGQSGRLGAPTSPISQNDMSERLGFLSEGEPGTPEETQGMRAYVLTAEFLLGRDPDAVDLAIPDASVGRVHARITRQEGVFYLTDLGSVNGTRLDGRRLDRHVQVLLPDRCRIGIADREFYFIAD